MDENGESSEGRLFRRAQAEKPEWGEGEGEMSAVVRVPTIELALQRRGTSGG